MASLHGRVWEGGGGGCWRVGFICPFKERIMNVTLLTKILACTLLFGGGGGGKGEGFFDQ